MDSSSASTPTAAQRHDCAATAVSGWLAWAARDPARVAVRDAQRSLDYAQFAHATLALAARLRRYGAGPGQVIGVACDRTVDAVVAIHAVLASGAAYLPLDLSYPRARLEEMVADARPTLVLATGANDTAAGLAAVTLDRSCAVGSDPQPATPAPPDAPAYILFTSGSTGRPKGVVVSCAALAHMVDWHVDHPRLGIAARTLQFATLGFDSSVRDLFAVFATGGSLVLADEEARRDPFRLLELIARERIERAFLPYVALCALAQAQLESGLVPRTLREVMTGGEALAITPAIRTFFGALDDAVLYNEYGPTEACVFVTSKALGGDPQGWPERPDIGSALPYAHLHVADDNLAPVAAGVEGELLIGGASLADGYVGRADLTAERFVDFIDAAQRRERVYRSGDRVCRHADGRIEYLGRRDDQVKIAGIRIELGDIEAALCAHPCVRAAAVVAPLGAGGRFLVAHVVAARTDDDPRALRTLLTRHLATRLPAHEVPHLFVLCAALPLTPNGKIDRRRLLHESAPAPVAVPALDATPEQRVCALWGELLGAAALDADANVFEAGADSLRVMMFVTRVHTDGLGRLQATAVYEYPTPRAQAQLLAGADAGRQNGTGVPVVDRIAQQRIVMARLRDRRSGSVA